MCVMLCFILIFIKKNVKKYKSKVAIDSFMSLGAL